MDELKPRNYTAVVSLIIILAGIVLLVIGLIIWHTGGSEKYLKAEDFSITNQGMDDVTSINLEIDNGIVRIKRGGDKLDCVVTNAPEGVYAHGIKDNKFYIEKKTSSFWFANNGLLNLLAGNKLRPTFEISIPDKLYDSFSVELGSGELEIDDIRAKYVKIESGAGEVNANNIVAENKLEADMGAGKQSYSNCEVGELDFDCGAGETEFSGSISDKVDIDGGVGAIKLTIYGNYNDYDLDIDKGIGGVDINKGDTSVGSTKNIPMKIDCGIGEIKLDFVNKNRGEVNS
ncbi:MAG: DUF4097 family beta strand repeat protein [Ruminococcus sp.]|nr:DUF4097 family beta strand repeat protein [Ruminococcus sp.]